MAGTPYTLQDWVESPRVNVTPFPMVRDLAELTTDAVIEFITVASSCIDNSFALPEPTLVKL